MVKSFLWLEHDWPCVDGDAGGERDAVGLLDPLRIAGEGFVDGKRSPDRPLGVVLVRGRSTEESEHPVAGELRDRASQALDLVAHQPHDFVE